MTSDKVVDLGLGLSVHVLEFVHRREFLNVQTVGEDTVCINTEPINVQRGVSER